MYCKITIESNTVPNNQKNFLANTKRITKCHSETVKHRRVINASISKCVKKQIRSALVVYEKIPENAASSEVLDHDQIAENSNRCFWLLSSFKRSLAQNKRYPCLVC